METALVYWKDLELLLVCLQLQQQLFNHLEKQKIVFAAEKIAVPGAWSMKFHFPDGAQYRVAAVANVPGMAPVRNEQVIAVTGVEPPATATVPVLSFFTALIAVGLGVGRWSKRRGGSQP